jgi:peptidoglycan/LPS O-acetylase OafA/YrhL
MKTNVMRVKSIDFLRGLAILLVLFRHVDYSPIAHLIGWSGVDLFFVLSGFLVSGLLFSEYKKNKTIQPLRFLARRGFKIYPLFWAVILYTVIIHYFTGFGTDKDGLLAELFFYQNYSTNTLFGISWSLAVEEHFYILLIIAVSVAVKFKALENKKGFHIFTFTVLAYCLVARIITSIQFTENNFLIHYSPTHLRMDSLAFGVIIAYNYHFNKVWLSNFVQKYTVALTVIMCLCLATLFIWDTHTVFMRTIGFTLVYLGFGILLNLFLLAPKFQHRFEQIVPVFMYQLVSKIGLYSYAIYLTHIQVLIAIRKVTEHIWHIEMSNAMLFFSYLIASVLVGMVLTYIIERPMLKWREKLFPAKKKAPVTTIIPQVQPA